MVNKIKKLLKNDCECYMVSNKIVCFLVGRFLYMGKPSDKDLGLPDDCHTIQRAREFALLACKEYIKNVEFSKAVSR